MTRTIVRAGLRAVLSVLPLALAGCSSESALPDLGPSTFEIKITAVNGSSMLPTADMPLPANHGDTFDKWDFTIQAKKPTGEDAAFDGYVRLSVKPGAVFAVDGAGASGRNMLLKGGKASGTVSVSAVYGPARLWAEDLGYLPAPAGRKAACSNGVDDNNNGLIDYPADPGCAFADDDNEDGGTFAAGASPPVQYALPKVSDVRGDGSATPYPYEAIEVATGAPQHVVVTRVASDGFYVTDVNPTEMANGYNSVFAFNFNTPAGMRVCDVLTYLSGTANDFFGFTELSFPSYQVSFPLMGQGTCEVPEPIELDEATINDPIAMQKLQSSLVRVKNVRIVNNFGAGVVDPKTNKFSTSVSSCDFNGDGAVDFTNSEGTCASICDTSAGDCTEWTAYSARGEYNVVKGGSLIKINTSTVAGFIPTDNRGEVLGSVTGTLRKFSGGTLNWTIETRCSDDLACSLPGCGATQPISSQTACVRLRTQGDNDEGTD